MVKIIYNIEELLNLRHHKITNLDEKLSEKLLASNNKQKSQACIHKKSSKFHSFSKYSFLKGYNPYFMKENKIPYGQSCNTRLSTHIYCHKLAFSNHNEKVDYYGNLFKYPLFGLHQFPPGSRIIRIEPGTPLPKGAIPIPFRFEDSQNGPSDSHFPYRLQPLKRQHVQLSGPKISNTSRKRFQSLDNESNIQMVNKAKIYPVMKNIHLDSIPNPYSVTGFFPECKKYTFNSNTDTITDNLNSLGLDVPTTSQASSTDTDSSTTVGSSCDSFNIQIQISAPR